MPYRNKHTGQVVNEGDLAKSQKEKVQKSDRWEKVSKQEAGQDESDSDQS